MKESLKKLAPCLRVCCVSAIALVSMHGLTAYAAGGGAGAISVGSGSQIKDVNVDIQKPIPTSAVQLRQEVKSEKPVVIKKHIRSNVVIFKKSQKIKTIRITGNVSVSTDQLVPLYQPLYGKYIKLDDLQKVANAIEDKYRKAGFPIAEVYIPKQNIIDGDVYIVVSEGHVDRIKIDGKINDNAKNLLLKYADRMKQCVPLTQKCLNRYSELAQNLPGLKIETHFETSQDDPAGNTLTFKVIKQSLIQGEITYHNRNKIYLDAYTVGGEVDVNSVLGTADQAGIEYMHSSHGDHFAYVEGHYNRPIGDDGLMLKLEGDYVGFHYGSTYETDNIVRRNLNLKASLEYPFIRSEKQNLYGIAGITFREATAHFDPDLYNYLDLPELAPLKPLVPAAGLVIARNTYFQRDSLRVINLGLNYNSIDKFYGYNVASVQLSRGLDAFGARVLNTVDASFDLPLPPPHDHQSASFDNFYQPDVKPEFTKISGEMSRLQPFSPTFFVLLALKGQYAFDPLLDAEQFSVGGNKFGRGYDRDELLGDSGYAAKIELQWLKKVNKPYLNLAQFYVFLDAGKIWQRGARKNTQMPEFVTPNGTSIASTGIGVNFKINDHLSANLEVAKPLSKNVNAYASEGKANPRAIRFFFGLKGEIL
jgi:hemolysin activation/secretion protein